MKTTLTINGRFNGPPNSANGGYACGLVAGFIDGAAEVTLRKPPPLDRPLQVEQDGQGGVRLVDEERLIAEGRPVALSLNIPEPPAYSEVEAAVAFYAGFNDHVFPTCFVCGPEREGGDGLEIYPGRVAGRGVVAAPWRPAESLGENGWVRPEFLWAALDCPGAFAVQETMAQRIVLGRLAAEIRQGVRVGKAHTVIGWPVGQEGRKHYAGTALYDAAGELCALGRATWIALGE